MKLLLALLVLALACLAKEETQTNRKLLVSGRKQVQELPRELATDTLRPRFSMAADMGRRGKTNKKKRPSQSQKKNQRPNVKKKKYTCTRKPLQAKCITVMVRSLKKIETKVNGHVGRKRFDILESEMTARVDKVSADLDSVKNSSMNLTSTDSQSSNISIVLARMEIITEVLNSTR